MALALPADFSGGWAWSPSQLENVWVDARGNVSSVDPDNPDVRVSNPAPNDARLIPNATDPESQPSRYMPLQGANNSASLAPDANNIAPYLLKDENGGFWIDRNTGAYLLAPQITGGTTNYQNNAQYTPVGWGSNDLLTGDGNASLFLQQGDPATQYKKLMDAQKDPAKQKAILDSLGPVMQHSYDSTVQQDKSNSGGLGGFIWDTLPPMLAATALVATGAGIAADLSAAAGTAEAGAAAGTAASSTPSFADIATTVGKGAVKGAITSELSGGDPIKGAITGGVVGGVAPFTNIDTGLPAYANAGILGAGVAAVSGGNALEGAALGAGGSLLNGALTEAGVPATAATAITRGTQAIATGRDPLTAVAGSLIGSGLDAAIDIATQRPVQTVDPNALDREDATLGQAISASDSSFGSVAPPIADASTGPAPLPVAQPEITDPAIAQQVASSGQLQPEDTAAPDLSNSSSASSTNTQPLNLAPLAGAGVGSILNSTPDQSTPAASTPSFASFGSLDWGTPTYQPVSGSKFEPDYSLLAQYGITPPPSRLHS